MDQQQQIKTLNKNLEKKQKEEEMKKAFVNSIKKHCKPVTDPNLIAILDKKLEEQQFKAFVDDIKKNPDSVKDPELIGILNKQKEDEKKINEDFDRIFGKKNEEEKKDIKMIEEEKVEQSQRDLQLITPKRLFDNLDKNKNSNKKIKTEQISLEDFIKNAQKEKNEDDISTIEDENTEDEVDISDVDTFEEDSLPIDDNNKNDYDIESSITVEDLDNNTLLYENFESSMIYDNMRKYLDYIRYHALQLKLYSKRHYDFTKRYKERKSKFVKQEDYMDNERIYFKQISCNGNRIQKSKRSIQISLNYIQDYLDNYTVYDTENHI